MRSCYYLWIQDPRVERRGVRLEELRRELPTPTCRDFLLANGKVEQYRQWVSRVMGGDHAVEGNYCLMHQVG